jgi:hypothetical protein
MSPPNDHVESLLDDYLHQLLHANESLRVARHCDSCPACRASLEAARRLLAAVHDAPMPAAPEALVQSVLQGVADADRKQRRLRRRVWTTFAAGVAAAVIVLACFQWYFHSLAPTPYDLTILGQTNLLSAARATLRVQLVNRVTGAALAGIPVKLELFGESTGSVELDHFDTDGDGRGQSQFRLPEWADGSYRLRVTAATPGSPEVIEQQVHLRRSWKVMLSSDKPVYQPGQTIHLRAMTLRRPDLRPVSGEEATFTVCDSKGNVIFKHRQPTSKHGIASADCELAGEILEGAYLVACKVGDASSQLAVEVKRYVLPKFKIDVRPDKPFYAPGEAARLTVQADYFYGKPVAGAAVEVEMTATGTQAAKDVQKARTDAKGHSAATFALPAKTDSDTVLTFHVTVTDGAGQTQTREVSRVVTSQPLRVEVLPECGSLVSGVSNRVYLLTTYADGSPAQTKITIEGRPGELQTDEYGSTSFDYTPGRPAVTWTVRATDARGVVGNSVREYTCGLSPLDFLVRTDQAVYDGGSTLRLRAFGGGTEPVFVDVLKDEQAVLTQTVPMQDGRGELALDLPPEVFGTLRLSAYRLAPDGSLQAKSRLLYVRPANQLTVKAALDQAEYRPGRRARLDLRLTDAGGNPVPAAVSLAGVDEAVFGVLERAPGSEQSFFNPAPEVGPVSLRHRWASESPSLGRMRCLGQAIFATAAFTEVGEALRGSRDRRIASLLDSRIWRTDSTYPGKVLVAEQRRRDGSNAVMIGWGLLPVGVVIAGLLAVAICARLFWQAAGMALSLFVGGLCFVIFGGLSLTPRPEEQARLRLRIGAANELPPVTLADRDLEETLIDARMAHAGVGLVFSIGNAVNFSFGEESVRVRGYELPWAATADAGPVRVRELFPETLLWRPELVTDDAGRVSLDFDLADSITSWRLTASAVSADGRLGATQTSLKVFQPFFVDVNLPVSLTSGDEVSVPVVVSSYLDKPQTVRLTLDDAPWCERLGPAEQRVELAPGEVKSVTYRLRAKLAGNHTLQVSARGGGVADAVKRSVEVVPDGKRVERVVNGALASPADVDLAVPADAVPGSVRAVLKVYPSGFSQLVEGLDGIFQMPYGCFEQTSSTTYPNVLALNYLRRTGQARPETEAKARHYLHLGYQRLLSFEVAGGGFDWFGRPPANRTLTAYGLLEFEDMARVFDVDPQLIARTRKWLLDQRQRDGSWLPEGHTPHDAAAAVADAGLQRLATTAYIARAVFGNGHKEGRESTLNYLLGYSPAAIDDPHALALVAEALLTLDNQAAAVPYLERLDTLKSVSGDGRQVWWEQAAGRHTTFFGTGRGGSVETTALAALAFLHAGSHAATSRAALTWIVAQRSAAGTWPSTQATVLSLQALLAGTNAAADDRERRIEVRLGGNFRQEIVIPADQAEVMRQIDLTPHLGRGADRLTLTESTKTAAGFQVALRYHVPDASAPAGGTPLSVAVAYDRTELAVGESVHATATATNRAATPAPMVMLELPVPAGFAAANEDFAALVEAQTVAKFQVRPRGVLVYLRDLAPGKPLTLKYRLTATTAAKVTAPAARLYEYYDPDRQGRGAEVCFTVK